MRSTFRARRAFTLMEIMVAVAIIGTLALVVSPALYNFMRNRESESVLSNLTQTLRFAQQQAVFTRQRHTVVIDVAASAYWIVEPPAKNDEGGRRRWRSRRDEETKSYAQRLPEGFQFGSVYYPLERRSAIDGTALIHFFPDGTATGAAILVQRLAGHRGSAREAALVVEAALGRVREMRTHERIELFGA